MSNRGSFPAPSGPGDGKGPGALRTIGEVAEDLSVEPHVLRYWEERFPQLKPVKRAGGRRLYRPQDVAFLRGLRHLLRERRLTIEGARKVLREEGIEAVRCGTTVRMDRESRRTLLALREDLALARKELAGEE